MKGLRAAVSAEVLKARRSIVPVTSFVVVTFMGCIGGLFMLIIQDPGRARSLGLLGTKASLSGLTADWPSLLDFLAQAVSVGDLLLFAFLLAWVFGREAADGTQRYLLALPVARSVVVAAKFCVVACWAALLNLWLVLLVLVIGRGLDLPGGGGDVVVTGVGTAFVAAGLILLGSAPVALVASAGRGYLAPLAFAIATMIVAQVATALGWGGLTPWSIPSVAAGLVPGVVMDPTAIAVVVVTAIGGVGGTLAWWNSGHAGA